MKSLFALFAAFFVMGTAQAAPVIGAPAPAILMKDVTGADFNLADQAGKIVVLEWTNPDCPFVKKHYGSGNMQALQKKYTGAGVVWVAVRSSAMGKEGYVDAAGAQKIAADTGAAYTTQILDAKGDLGRAYEAKTTPHMFVIDRTGKLAYMGAIDDNSSADPATIPEAKNYVAVALDSLLKEEAVATTATQPYGCSVKY